MGLVEMHGCPVRKSTSESAVLRGRSSAAKFDLCTVHDSVFGAAGVLRELFELVAMLVGRMELLRG